MKPHHGKISNLSLEQNLEVLERNHFAHLACHLGEELYIVPISYVLNDGCLYAHSKLGKKIEMMRKNPKICIQVEEVKNFFNWKSVIAWGDFEELEGETAAFGMRALIKKMASSEEDKPMSELEIDFDSYLESAIIFKMKIIKMTGRFEERN